MTQLSSLLLHDRVVSAHKLDEAHERLAQMGGDLATCLLEVGALGEDTLTAYHAASLGVAPCSRADLLDADLSALSKLARAQAELFGAVPLFFDPDGVLQVAVAEAPTEVLRDALRALFRQPIELVAVLPFRLRWAMWRYYQSPLDARLVRLGEQLSTTPPGPLPQLGSLHAMTAAGSQSVRPASRALAALLDDEDEDDEPEPLPSDPPPVLLVNPRPSVHARGSLPPPVARTTGSVAPPRRVSAEPRASERPPEAWLDPDPHSRTTAIPEEPVPRVRSVKPSAEPSRVSNAPQLGPPVRPSGQSDPAMRVPASVHPPVVARTPPSTRPLPPVQSVKAADPASIPGTRGALAPPSVPKFDSVPAPAPSGRPGPPAEPRQGISLEEAELRLSTAQDRDAVVAAMLEHLITEYQFAALWVWRGDRLEGLAVRGPETPTTSIRTHQIAVDACPGLGALRDLAGVSYQPIAHSGADGVLRAALGREGVPMAVLAPVKLRGRAALLLWADLGSRPAGAPNLVELERFVDLCGAAFARLLVTRKQGPSLAPVAQRGDGQGSGRPGPSTPPAGSESERPWQPSPEQRMAALRAAVLGQPAPRRSVPPGPVATGDGSRTPSARSTPRPATPRPRTPRPITGGAAGLAVPGPVGPRVGTLSEAERLVGEVARTGILSDETAATLVAMGDRALEAVFRYFPGVHMPLGEQASRGPAVEELGPILRLTLRFRQAAVPWLLRALDSADADVRLCAMVCLGEVLHPAAIARLSTLVLDAEPATRALAIEVLKPYQRFTEFESVLRTLRTLVRDTRSQPEARRVAAASLGEFRDVPSVETLIDALVDNDPGLVEAAHRALVLLTRQDHGPAPEGWRHWHERMRARHRVEWLIEALLHSEAGLRHDASEELKKVTGQFFGYYFNLPRKERERAHQRYLEWWRREGALRFTGRPAP